MPTLYDDEGNPIELPVDPKELPTVIEKAKSLEEQLSKTQADLKKLQEKDLNFAKLRTKDKAERESFVAEMSAKERMFYDEIESLKGEITKRDQATVGKLRDERLKQFSGGDEDLEKKILANYERLGANPLSAEEVEQSLEEAFALTQAQMSRTQSVNPINRYSPTSAGVNPWGSQKKNYADTADGQDFAKSLGLNITPQK